MLGVPELFINLLINLHMNSTANFRFNGVIYPTVIPLSSGLKQGCVAAPILFLIFFSAIFSLVYSKLGDIVGSRIFVMSSDGGLHSIIKIWEFMFADDVAIVSYNKEDTQRFIDCFNDVCKKFGMEISGIKTEILHQKRRSDRSFSPSPSFYLNNNNGEQKQELKVVQHFKYLGTIFTPKNLLIKPITVNNVVMKYNNPMDADIIRRISNSWCAFSKFKNIFCNKNMPLQQRVLEYQSRCSIHLIQALHTRAYLDSDINKLEVIFLKQLKTIYGISKSGVKSRDEIYDLCKVSSIKYQYYKNVLLFVCKINNLKDRNEFNRPVIHITKALLYHHRWLDTDPKGNPGNFITFEEVIRKAMWFIKDNALSSDLVSRINQLNSNTLRVNENRLSLCLISYNEFRSLVDPNLIKEYINKTQKAERNAHRLEEILFIFVDVCV